MLIIIFLIPLIAGLAILVWPRISSVTGLTGSALSFLLSLFLFFTFQNQGSFELILPGLPDMPLILLANHLSVTLLLVVTSVALFIFTYAVGYMKSEEGKTAFWSGISLFLAAMILLVLAGDWISFIIGWEIMGFASYRLIATWHWKKEAREGATKAFMITRFTDMGLYIGIFLVILHTGTSEILPATEQIPFIGGMALLVAVMGKSAQVPFQSWLSGAMAGPTPVSSLLHSATMVAAGIILLLRAYPLLPDTALTWIGLIGGITILLTGITAVFSDDVKKMLAASTSSQLGFMLLAIGTGYPGAAAAHLIAHAYMKSSLFLGTGVWQHAYDSTLFEKIRAAGKKYKITYAAFGLAGIALAGIPPLIGYWSKDAVLAAGLKTSGSLWYFSAAVAGALLTAIYIGKALVILWKKENPSPGKIHGKNWMMTGMILLVLVVIAGGFFLEPVVKYIEFELPHSTAAIIAGIIAAILGLVFGWLKMTGVSKKKWPVFLRNNYPVGGGYQNWVVRPVLKVAYYTSRMDIWIHKSILAIGSAFYHLSLRTNMMDNGIEFLVRGFAKLNLDLSIFTRIMDEAGIEKVIERLTIAIKKAGNLGKQLQSGMVHQEMMWSVVGLISFVIILIFSIF